MLLNDKTALITGAARGIGRLMAMDLLERGIERVFLWDRDEAELGKTFQELNGRFPGRVLSYAIDVTQTVDMEKAIRLVPKIDILFNNAGIVSGGKFKDHNKQDIDSILNVNVHAPMQLARIVLPGMIDRNFGRIVNVSSAASLSAVPLMSVYAASKWAMAGWSESLRLELEMKKTGVSVLTVYPYYIDTGMFSGVRSLIPILKPEYVAQKIVKSMLAGCIQLKMPRLLYFSNFFRGILPVRLYDLIIGQGLGIYRSMTTFQGRESHSKKDKPE